MEPQNSSSAPLVPRRSLEALQRLRSRIQQAFLLDGGVTLAGLLLLGLAGSFVVDYFLVLPAGVRGVFLASAGVLLAWGFRRRIALPLSLKVSDQDLANLVERANPQLGQELITAIELTRADSSTADHVSPALVDNVVRSVEAKIDGVLLDSVFVLGRLKKKAALAIGGAVLALVLAAFNMDLVGIWFSRNVLLSSQRWPKSIQLELVRPVPPVRVAVGDALELEVRVRRGLPAKVVVEYFTASRQTHTDVLTEVAPGIFQQTIGNVSRPFSFRVRGGDDELDLVDVDVRIRPRIEMSSMRLWCEYPAYTGLEKTLEDEPLRFGNLKVPTGTRVSYRMGANVPLARAFFVFRGMALAAAPASKPEEAAEDLAPWPDAGAEPLVVDATGEFHGAFEVKESGQYYFQLEASDGFQSRRPDRFRVEAVPDQKPMVKILEPERPNEEVTAEARIPVRVAASDDYRVQKVVLEGQYFVPGKDKGVEQFREFKRWSAANTPDGAPDVAPPPDGARNPRQPVEDELLVAVAELATGGDGPPRPGGRFQFWAPAMDSAGQTASSEEHSLLIVEKDDLLKILTDQLMLVRDQLKEVDRKQKSARKDLEEAQAKLILVEKIAATEASRLLRHGQDQRRVTQALEREAAELGRILARTLRNQVGDEAWRSWTTDVRDDVQALAAATSPRIETAMEAIRKDAAGSPQEAARLGEVVNAQRDLEREVLSIVLRLSEFGDKNAQIQRLREIRRRLDDVRSATRNRAQGNTPEEPQK